MIVNHLSRVMGERRLNMQEVARLAGISPTTVFDFYHDRTIRYDRNTLDQLCRVLGVGVGDLLEYRADAE